MRGTRDRIAGPEEAAALLSALPRDRAIWATAMYAELRHGELQALRVQDVDLATGLIHVRRSWDPEAGPVLPKSRAGCGVSDGIPARQRATEASLRQRLETLRAENQRLRQKNADLKTVLAIGYGQRHRAARR